MRFRLADHIACCVADGRAILLDLQKDRYLSLGVPAQTAFAKILASMSLDTREINGLKPLISGGYISEIDEGSDWSYCAPQIPEPRQTYPLNAQWPGCRLAILVVKRLISSVRAVRSGRLEATLALLQATEPSASIRYPVGQIVQAFNWSALIFSSVDRCLPRSIAMKEIMIKSGHECDLVIGVTSKPFSAHCWIQIGECVMNDHVDHVRLFTPILIV